MSDTQQRIDDLVKNNEVLLFMKGNASFPQCGFSARVVQVLKEVGTDFRDVNILNDPDLREGLKAYSNWPTFPQLYVNGKLIGGCDIVNEMFENGELAGLVKKS